MSNVPKLRFKEFSGEWIEKKLKSILLDFRLGGNYSNSETINSKPLIKMGNLNRGNIVLNKIEYIADNENIDELDRIKYGDLFFNTRNTLDLVGKVAIWKNELPDAYYNSNLMWMKYENNFFMNYRFNTFQGIKALRRIATGTTSVAAIYTKDLLKISFNVPEGDEQEKIASFLASVDTKIEQLTKKEQLLQQYKKGVMQKIFNQEIRFKAYDGSEFCEWEEKSLNELVEFSNGKAHENDIDESGDYIVVNSKFISSNGTVKKYSNSQIAPLYKNDIVMVMSDVPNGKALSKCYLIDENNKYTLNQRICSLRQTINNNKFLIYLINRNKYYLAFDSGVGQTNLRKDEVLNLKLKVPCLEEQNKIANFLSSIDCKIEQTQKQLESSKEFKKALLQQMFV